MYFRWKAQRRRPQWAEHVLVQVDEETQTLGRNDGFITWSAQIVQGRRVHGQPRQHVIAHLGSVPEYNLGDPLTRVWFWEHLYRRLASVVGLDKEMRASVLEKIAERVPKPTDAERDEHTKHRRHRRETHYWIATARGGFRVASRRVPDNNVT